MKKKSKKQVSQSRWVSSQKMEEIMQFPRCAKCQVQQVICHSIKGQSILFLLRSLYFVLDSQNFLQILSFVRFSF